MKRTLLFLVVLVASPAMAQTSTPATYTLSSGLVEDIFKDLSSQPYGVVAPLIAKLQTEVQHQAVPQAKPVEIPKNGK